jgi:hypothetical protein
VGGETLHPLEGLPGPVAGAAQIPKLTDVRSLQTENYLPKYSHNIHYTVHCIQFTISCTPPGPPPVHAPEFSDAAPRGHVSPSGGAWAVTMWEFKHLTLSPVSGLGLEIVGLGMQNGPLRPQCPLEKVGGFAPHFFQCVLLKEEAI